MVFYILTIVLGTAGIFAGNYFFNPAELSLAKIIILSLIQPVIMIAWDGLGAYIIHWVIPGRLFSADSNFIKVGKKECKFYEALGIKKWKDHILELGFLGGFSKKKVANPDDPEYIKLFIQECNVGSMVHFVNLLQDFPILFCFPHKIALYFVLPACIINAILSILPMMVLRYNIPRLSRLLVILEKKALKNKTENN